jgi:hypothetical protein
MLTGAVVVVRRCVQCLMHDAVITEPKGRTSHPTVASRLYRLPLATTIASQAMWSDPCLLSASAAPVLVHRRVPWQMQSRFSTSAHRSQHTQQLGSSVVASSLSTHVVMVFSRKVVPVVPLIAFSASSFKAYSTSA